MSQLTYRFCKKTYKLVDIFILNETKLDCYDDESLFTHDKYICIRRDHGTNRGGGVLIYIKKSFNISNVSLDKSAEIISFRFTSDNSTFGLIACYRPPHPNNEKDFFDALETVISSFNDECEDIFIVGDLNYDLIDPFKSAKLINFNIEHGFNNTIKSGTRINPITGYYSLLDVILCLNLLSFVASTVITGLLFLYLNSNRPKEPLTSSNFGA